ncbi:MAG: NADH-quinone oxidoreductase subunit NuoK [Candidatus Omnitrophica bacterium]|nr:NADH-quinone oxidoreductase subunit NuoK [Candidatus Omnitrophota bacterium]
MIPLTHYLIFANFLFVIGIFGALVRRNIIGILIALELILNAVNVNFVAFSQNTSPDPATGQIFAFFVIAIAAAEATVGLAIVLALFRVRKTILTDEIHLLKW